MKFLKFWIIGLITLIALVLLATTLTSAQSVRLEPVAPTVTVIRNEKTSWGKVYSIDDPSANTRCIGVINDAANGGGAAIACYGRSY